MATAHGQTTLVTDPDQPTSAIVLDPTTLVIAPRQTTTVATDLTTLRTVETGARQEAGTMLETQATEIKPSRDGTPTTT